MLHVSGFDGSLMGNMLVMPSFDSIFDISIDGTKAGIVTSIFTIGGVAAIPVIGPVTDMFGRRGGILCGCWFVIIGTIVQGTSSLTGKLAQYMGGRSLLGFGVAISGAAAPSYVSCSLESTLMDKIVEISHPAYWGTMTGMYNTVSKQCHSHAEAAVRPWKYSLSWDASCDS